jgi:hypothetical protein
MSLPEAGLPHMYILKRFGKGANGEYAKFSESTSDFITGMSERYERFIIFICIMSIYFITYYVLKSLAGHQMDMLFVLSVLS